METEKDKIRLKLYKHFLETNPEITIRALEILVERSEGAVKMRTIEF